MAIIWCMVPKIWSAADKIFCYSGLFFPFLPPYGTRKSKFFWKWKKQKSTWKHYHLQMCTINNSHRVYGSRDIECKGQIFLSFWTVFCSFTPLANPKIKIFEIWKKYLVISSFYICVPKIMIRWCMVPEIWCVTDGRTDRWTDGWTEKVTYRGGGGGGGA